MRDARTDALPDGFVDDSGPGVDARQGGVESDLAYLDECKQFADQCSQSANPHCGACQYRFWYRGDRCTKDTPCSNAVLLWAAGGCELAGVDSAMRALLRVHPDFVFFCLQPSFPGEVLPSSLGAPERDDMLVAHVFDLFSSPDHLGVWTGDNLLILGCSAGATRYPVVAAHFEDDERWMGSIKTAVCMSEGVVDIPGQDRFVGEAEGPTCEYRHERIARGFTVSDPVAGHACEDSPQGQCACDPAHSVLPYPGNCADGDCVAFESIMTLSGQGWEFSPGISAAAFSVRHWKLVSEGGAFFGTEEQCQKDVVPFEPWQAFCAALDADASHDCRYERHPDSPHCSYFLSHLDALCLSWFLGLD